LSAADVVLAIFPGYGMAEGRFLAAEAAPGGLLALQCDDEKAARPWPARKAVARLKKVLEMCRGRPGMSHESALRDWRAWPNLSGEPRLT